MRFVSVKAIKRKLHQREFPYDEDAVINLIFKEIHSLKINSGFNYPVVKSENWEDILLPEGIVHVREQLKTPGLHPEI